MIEYARSDRSIRQSPVPMFAALPRAALVDQSSLELAPQPGARTSFPRDCRSPRSMRTPRVEGQRTMEGDARSDSSRLGVNRRPSGDIGNAVEAVLQQRGAGHVRA